MKSNFPIIPYFCIQRQIKIPPQPTSIIYDSFALAKRDFGKLTTDLLFQRSKDSAIEVDITHECLIMTEESYLEVRVPVLALNDVLGNIEKINQQILHPTLLAVNGFGAKKEDKNSFAHVDFINVLDIADNRFELVVAEDGKIEWPKQGLGLYSILKEINYILSYRQAIAGDGLADMSFVGAKRGKLYVQPPFGTQEDLGLDICVTHIDHRNRRIVDSIRSVKVEFTSLDVNSTLPLLFPSLIFARFSEERKLLNEYEKMGWQPHPIGKNIWYNRVGLSLSARMNLIKQLYSEHEFMRDFLNHKGIQFSSLEDYNNFLLRPETFSKIYSSLIHDIAYGYISKEYLIDVIDIDVLSRLDLSNLTADFHDKTVLIKLQKNACNLKEFLSNLFGPVSRYTQCLLPASCTSLAISSVEETNLNQIPDLPYEWSDCRIRP